MAAIQFGEELLLGAVCSVTLPDTGTKYYVQRVTENDPICEVGKVQDHLGVTRTMYYTEKIDTVVVDIIPHSDHVHATTFPAFDNITIGSDKWFVASAPTVREAKPVGWTVRLEKWNLTKVV